MYAQPSNTTPRSANKKERALRVVFGRAQGPVHCGGVEALLLLPERGCLLTASRDSTVKRWGVQSSDSTGMNPNCQASYDAHTDWVNDLTVYGELLFSCSNDKTVRVWQAQSTGVLLSSMCHHSDYVTCLAAARHKALVASAGLRGEVFLIDATNGATHRLRPKIQPRAANQQGAQPADLRQQSYSNPATHAEANGNVSAGGQVPHSQAGIYSLTLSGSGSLLAAGSSDHVIRLWDTRSGEKISKLRGHTDNVRCLLLKDDCSLLLSGGADGTIRLWDLNMQRCINTYTVHSDSVWCLDAAPDWSVVYSGGRDKCVYRTRLNTRSAELLFQESAPVTSLAIDHQAGHMWVATPRASVNEWAIPAESPPAQHASHAATRHRLSSMALGSMRRSVEALTAAPLVTAPSMTIPGLPAITSHKVLTDRRHVLTKDEQGNVSLWDVLAGSEVAQYGQVDVDAQERALFEARHCPAWFTADNRLGTLSISLEPPNCFNAEDYAQALGYTNAPDDLKVNYGKLVLEGVFAKWKHTMMTQLQQSAAVGVSGRVASGPAGPQAMQQQQQQLVNQHSGSLPSSRSNSQALAASPQQPMQTAQQQMQQQGDQRGHHAAAYYTEPWPRYWSGVHPVVMCISASGLPWRRGIDEFTGEEGEPEDVPTWVGDVVLRDANVTPREAKCAFVLLPAEGSNLPSLLQSRLTAPRILQVHKVASYCVGRLMEAKIQLVAHPVYLRLLQQQQQQQQEATGERPPGPEMELICNGYAVPYELSLSAVKKFIWGKQDDIVFQYRIRDPQHPAPLPNVQPSKQ